MDALQFHIAGLPRGKGRPRATVRGAHATVYTDAATRRYEASISALARQRMAGRAAFAGPLSVSIQFRMPIPKSAPKGQRLRMAAGEIAHTSKPDVDNMAKAILDGMACDAKDKKTPIVFVNDSQITRLFVSKIYHQQPGVDIRVEPLGEP